MKLIRATEADSDRLIQFYQSNILPGPIDLRFDRVNSFFHQYRLQSEDYLTYLLVNDKDEIETLASIIFRDGWINGEKQTVGYATDLRVSSSRKAILQWAQHFLPIMQEERERRNCKYVFSVVGQEQRQAINAFVRPRSTRRQIPRYYLYRRFKIVTLHGLYPFAAKPLDSIHTRYANREDLDSLSAYILNKKHAKTLHYHESQETWIESLRRWPSLDLENFLIAFDSQNNIIGCVAPWSSHEVQKVVAAKYSTRSHTFKDTLGVLSILGIGKRLPHAGDPLDFSYLTHFNADNPDIFYSLLWQAYKDAPNREFLIYPHFEGDLQTTPPRSFISGNIQAGLYCILSPHETLPDFLRPNPLSETPDFELAWL